MHHTGYLIIDGEQTYVVDTENGTVRTRPTKRTFDDDKVETKKACKVETKKEKDTASGETKEETKEEETKEDETKVKPEVEATQPDPFQQDDWTI